MKIKIAKNVIHKGKILNADQVHELPNKEAQALIDGEFASEHKEPEPPKAPEPNDPPKK
jgi:hypothetical protein